MVIVFCLAKASHQHLKHLCGSNMMSLTCLFTSPGRVGNLLSFSLVANVMIEYLFSTTKWINHHSYTVFRDN